MYDWCEAQGPGSGYPDHEGKAPAQMETQTSVTVTRCTLADQIWIQAHHARGQPLTARHDRDFYGQSRLP